MPAPRLNEIHQKLDDMKADLQAILDAGAHEGTVLRQDQKDEIEATIDSLDSAKAALVCVQGFSAYSQP
jgi:hypothetical protein